MISVTKKMSKTEELIEFYNKYLALGNDEALLLMLIEELGNLFVDKVDVKGAKAYLYDLDKDLMELRYTEEDLKRLSCFARNCLNFYSAATIILKNGETAYINRFGTIITVTNFEKNSEYVGKNIFDVAEYLQDKTALKNAKNVILQNILASKIYNAVRENIERKTSDNAKKIFELINSSVLTYENDLTRKETLTENLRNGFPRIRSER